MSSYVPPNTRNTGNVMSGFLDSDYVYGTHIKNDGECLAFRWHYPTGNVETIDMRSIAGNAMDMPLEDLNDGHYTLETGVDDQDHVFIAGNHHENVSRPNTPHLIQCTNVGDFTNPSSWILANTDHWSATSDAGNHPGLYTYHQFDRYSDGTLVQVSSQSDNPGYSRGRDVIGFRRQAGVWTALASDGHIAETFNVPNNSGPANRVYFLSIRITKLQNNNERLHYYGIWRTADFDANSQKAPFYIYSDDKGATWYNVSGELQAMPRTWANRASAEITPAPTYSPTTRNSLVIDPITQAPTVVIRNENTTEYWRITWQPATQQWTHTIYDISGGATREHRWKGEIWVQHTRNWQATLTRLAQPRVYISIGGRQPRAAGTLVTHCPVLLREKDLLVFNIGNGDMPVLRTLGDNARRRSV